MTKDELKNRLESAEKQMEGLKDEIENLKAKLNDAQDEEIPEFTKFEGGENYYYMDDYLDVDDGFASDEECDFNRFHTREYAHLFADKCREIAMLLHCKWYVNRYYVPDFDNSNQMKWTVNYDHWDGCYKPDYWFSDDPLTVCFENKETAQKAADWMNAHAKNGGKSNGDSE